MKRAGFTLIELMLVIAIIGMLAGMIVPRLAGSSQKARIARAKADIAAIGVAADLFELDAGRYPKDPDELMSAEPPSDVQGSVGRWSGPYLKKRGQLADPWGRPYVYTDQSQHQQDYDLSSLGPDGQPGNDDVTNWD